jgi:hypothetical protein
MRGASKWIEAGSRRRVVRTSAMVALAAGLLAPVAGCERTGDAGTPAADRTRVEVTPAGADTESVKAPPSDSAPKSPLRVVVDPLTLDFGIIPPNTNKTGTISVRNEGDVAVKLLRVKPSCKCTTFNDLTGTMIEPGSTATLTTELEGQSMSGLRTSSIKFAFEGYDEILKVDVRAEVALPVRASPSILNMARGATSGHVIVESMDDRPFTILTANRRPPRYVGFDPEIDERRNSYMLEWDLGQELADKRLPHWWVIETDHPDCQVLDAWVRHQITIVDGPPQRRWRVADRRVLLGPVEPGQAAEFSVRVTDLGADRIYAVRSLSREFEARLLNFEPTGADGRCTVRITPAADHRGLLHGRVEFMASKYTHAIDVVGKVAP